MAYHVNITSAWVSFSSTPTDTREGNDLVILNQRMNQPTKLRERRSNEPNNEIEIEIVRSFARCHHHRHLHLLVYLSPSLAMVRVHV